MHLEETVRDLAARFGLESDDLNLDLEPLGRLFQARLAHEGALRRSRRCP